MNDKLRIHKKACLDTSIDNFKTFSEELIEYNSPISIGHTRWSTHGIISDINAHPHVSNSGKICLVHNGIIENYKSLKKMLLDKGFTFYSETDSEVIVNLIDYHLYSQLHLHNDTSEKVTIDKAIMKTVEMLEGTYGLAIQYIDNPSNVYIIKNGSPILIGENDKYIMACSESSGFLDQMKHYYALENDNLVILSSSDGIITNIKRTKIQNNNVTMSLTPEPYDHWTLKEIMEQSDSLLRAYNNGARITGDRIKLGGLDSIKKRIHDIQTVIFLGCGTSLYACHIGRHYLKQMECVNNTMCFDAADLELNDIPLNGLTLLVMCSQSGETKDLHRVLQLIQHKKNIITMGVINVVDSMIAREVDCGIYMNAGREVAVASTKSFTSSVTIFKMFSLWFSQELKNVNMSKTTSQSIKNIPYQIKGLNDNIINNNHGCLIKSSHINMLNHENIFVLGKGSMEHVSKEMSLKLKEICYIHAEGYSGTALKHGPFALLQSGYPVILLINRENRAKMWNAYKEIETRGANILVISEIAELGEEIENDRCIVVPENKELQEIIYMTVLQHICYRLSIKRGINPDKPRNLAKVVTVE
jgi:glucosamine--fructose-6-phosphate aminotransferase (isomerizing)